MAKLKNHKNFEVSFFCYIFATSFGKSTTSGDFPYPIDTELFTKLQKFEKFAYPEFSSYLCKRNHLTINYLSLTNGTGDA